MLILSLTGSVHAHETHSPSAYEEGFREHVHVLCDVCEGHRLPVYQHHRHCPTCSFHHVHPGVDSTMHRHWYTDDTYVIHLGHPRVWYMDWNDDKEN